MHFPTLDMGKKGHWSKSRIWTQNGALVKGQALISFTSVYLQPFLLNDACKCYFLDPATIMFVSGVFLWL